MKNKEVQYGIEGQRAPELSDEIDWVDDEGKKRNAIQLSDYKGKFKVVYGFQAWCPGCHSQGLPSLQQMVKDMDGNDEVKFFAVQTVFEGSHANTKERMLDIQKQYDLHIPFEHEIGNQNTRNVSSIMYNYRTGGTPWFIFIDKGDTVVFNGFHLNTEKAVEFLNRV
jgi:thiol-disulfide isomerase/thioredoxin